MTNKNRSKRNVIKRSLNSILARREKLSTLKEEKRKTTREELTRENVLQDLQQFVIYHVYYKIAEEHEKKKKIHAFSSTERLQSSVRENSMIPSNQYVTQILSHKCKRDKRPSTLYMLSGRIPPPDVKS